MGFDKNEINKKLFKLITFLGFTEQYNNKNNIIFKYNNFHIQIEKLNNKNVYLYSLYLVTNGGINSDLLLESIIINFFKKELEKYFKKDLRELKIKKLLGDE